MFDVVAKKIFGSKNERYLKSLQPIVDQINELEPQMQHLQDEDFPKKISEYKEHVANGKELDDLLPEVFALVREASNRTLGLRPFDVQLLGAIVLHKGIIAEMKTGEGKTLVATMPLVLNALTGKGVHLITVNDYLAGRDAEWMGQIYNFLGMSVGHLEHDMDDDKRKEMYSSDIIYGTNNEFGFDYLRDNMKFYPEQLVQGDLHYAIVDEVDSVLIDESRTPLIISGPAEDSTTMYKKIDNIIPSMKKDQDFTIDEKAKTVMLTDDGVIKCEKLLNLDNLFDPQNINYQHHILQALKAHYLFTRDEDYIVKDGQVIIVDEFTGRIMPGRRFSDGLHQALEAKENVKIEAENQTLATITFQNFFRMYDKLAGMTGTADTEAVEFKEIYNLDVIVIPTHEPMVREDYPDVVYMTQKEKYDAIIEEIRDLYRRGQPVLVGTTSIDKSEFISNRLKKMNIPHEVLNAKQHEKEAEIIASAGERGRVTIATNMAGRGTDIVLGEGVRELGGLHILGTERHESRRIDNQLRGRSGRQGDPGSSRFYLALDDDLLRLFGSDRISGMMDKMGVEEGQAIENKMISRAIENAQGRVEEHNFDIRKQLLEFDDVMNQQREVIYTRRREVMMAEDLESYIQDFIDDLLDEMYSPFEGKGKDQPDQETRDILHSKLEEVFALDRVMDIKNYLPSKEEARKGIYSILDYLKENAGDQYQELLRYFLLESLDRYWKEHLLNMDYMKEGIGLRGYGQKDPRREYKKEGFELFQELLYLIKESTIKNLCHIKIKDVSEEQLQHEDPTEDLQFSSSGGGEEKPQEPYKRDKPKVGRNEPCPCGSGRKYKKCCGAT
uniref:Preprotein translocase, SecA subunit n=1 Tax=uncultured organism TaxID=155900 RepID=M1PWX5_9ZZZZ|nr:preprotein translocase, SecA subunit [uncultured organism]